MNPKELLAKRPFNAERGFPRPCVACGACAVVPLGSKFESGIRHDGRLHRLTIPRIEIPTCQACGTQIVTDEVDRELWQALRVQLGLLSPAEIREGLQRVGMTQKEAAQHLGIAEATLSRWVSEAVVQSRAMDNLLRLYLDLPQVRDALRIRLQNGQAVAAL